MESPIGIALVVTETVGQQERRVLREVGLMRLGDPPFDHVAQLALPSTRQDVERVPVVQLSELLDHYLGKRDADRKRLTDAPTELQREALAWALAKEQAEQALVRHTAPDVTRPELDTATARLEGSTDTEPVRRSAMPDVPVLTATGKAVSPDAIFNGRRGRSAFSLEEWCALPTRPIVTPTSKPGPGAGNLAEFLFDKILYSKQVCDRNGQAVGLSQAKRNEYLGKIRYSIEQGLPITATEYLPLVAISNPIKRNTQAPSLSEVDVMRRLAEVSHAVELHYPAGMRWLLGNEAPAFQGPNFGLSPAYVDQFQNDCFEIMRLVDPTGARLGMFDSSKLLWGTPARREQWEAYEAQQLAQWRQAYADPKHPAHEQITQYLDTYVYPMATCISPYQFEAAHELSIRQIAEVYGALKDKTGSAIRGVGVLSEQAAQPTDLAPAQQQLLSELHATGLNLAFQYRVAMDSRDELPAFKEVIPDYAIGYTMVTKREKLVLYPNSGRGAYFPAHGEPVLVRPKESKQRTVVTVRPWWQIASQPERYLPMYVEGRDEPLYFAEDH
jgi:hypothetical protein